MTTFQSALSGGSLTKLRSTSYSADFLVKFCSNRVVFAARLNGAQTGDLAGFAFNNVTVGAYTDIVVGQVVLIGDTSDISKARFRGRVRKTPTSVILWTNESVVSFADQAYLWVIDTFDAQYKLSRPDANGNEVIDYDLAYEGMAPSITGLQTVYANYDPAGGNYRIAFSVTAFAKQSGGSIASYAWTFKAGTYTVVSGSLASNAVTVDISPSEQWGKLVVTDNAGVTETRHFLIQACDDSLNPPDSAIEPFSITCDLQRGWSLSLNAFAGVDSILNNTVVVVFRANEQYGGTAGGLFTNNINFFGWCQRESALAMVDRDAGPIETVSFDFNSISSALARLNSQLVPFFNSATPTAWGYIKNLTVWRGIAHYLDRYTTIGSLCDLYIEDTSDNYFFPTLTTQGGNALAVIRSLAATTGSVIEFAPDGRVQMVRDATYQNSLERAADVVIADLQTQDAISLQRDQEINKGYGLTDTDGAYYNMALGHTLGFTARAPGIARDEADGSDNLPNQIMASTSDDTVALAELLQRVTNRFEFVNNNEYLEAEFPDDWNFLIPSRQQLYTWTISAITASGVNRIIYDTSTSWLLESVTVARAENGVTAVRGRFHVLQRIGTGGINTTLVPPGDTPLEFPDPGIPSFPFQDPAIVVDDAGGVIPVGAGPNPIIADATGQTVAAFNSNSAWIQRNFINMTTPPSTFITPSDLGNYAVQQILFDPFSPADALGCFILGYDGTNSAVWYTSNVLAAPPTWVKGADTTGQYNVIRATATAGVVALYGANNTPTGGWTITLDFTAVDYTGQYGLSYNSQGGGVGAYSAGNGWGGLGVYRVFVNPTANGDATTFLSSISCTFSLVNPSGSGYFDVQFTGVGGNRNDPAAGGDYTYSTPYVNGPYNPYVLPTAFGNFFGPNYPGNNYVVRIKSVTYQGTGTTPTLS